MSEVEASILSDIFSSNLTPTDVKSAILSRTSYPDPWLADNTDAIVAIAHIPAIAIVPAFGKSVLFFIFFASFFILSYNMLKNFYI